VAGSPSLSRQEERCEIGKSVPLIFKTKTLLRGSAVNPWKSNSQEGRQARKFRKSARNLIAGGNERFFSGTWIRRAEGHIEKVANMGETKGKKRQHTS